MQDALQFKPHKPHSLHLEGSITGRNRAKREKKLSVVPTGQMLLQYSRPVNHASRPTASKVTPATIITWIS